MCVRVVGPLLRPGSGRAANVAAPSACVWVGAWTGAGSTAPGPQGCSFLRRNGVRWRGVVEGPVVEVQSNAVPSGEVSRGACDQAWDGAEVFPNGPGGGIRAGVPKECCQDWRRETCGLSGTVQGEVEK